MKILHVLDHSIPLHSGYTFRSRAILREQHALGWVTDHITSAKHTEEFEGKGKAWALEEEVEGLHFYRTPLSTGALARLPVLNQWAVVKGLTQRLVDIIPKVKPDVMHAHSPALNGMAALRAARRFNLPVVYEVRAFWEDAAVDHGTCKEGDIRYRATHAMETYVLKHAAAVTCICEGLRSDIVARGISQEKVTVIPNAVDIEHFQVGGVAEPGLAAQLDLRDKIVLGFIGSFYSYEGLRLLLDALPSLLARAPEIRVLLVGGGYEEQALKQQAKTLDICDKVIFTGRVPHIEVQRYYDLVDLLIYPRLAMRLTNLVTPLKPLEAMAQGRLVVASDVGGHKELIRHAETGWLFRAGDAQALARTVLDLLQRREQWPAVRRNGREFVERERNWRVSVARYQTVYERALEANRARG